MITIIESTSNGVYTAKCPECNYKWTADETRAEDIREAKNLVARHVKKQHLH